MYPGMAKTAREEGFDEIADWFETLAKAERSHANRFQRLWTASRTERFYDLYHRVGQNSLTRLILASSLILFSIISSVYFSLVMTTREGSLEPPKRHPLDWENPEFYDESKLFHEMERVFDICHGCRRCVNLCTAFPRLFDLIDNGSTGDWMGWRSKNTGRWRINATSAICAS